MKRLIPLLFITFLSGCSVMVPATVTTLSSISAETDFVMSKYDTFTSSDGTEVTVHASTIKEDRFLVMSSDYVSVFSSADQAALQKAALEYAKQEGYDVILSNPVEYYYHGTNGYAFDVTEK
ncbi:OmpH family outer membrane protein [Psychromonas aquimarina]|uniref:OmpH family outer membrane protein n=1 Tax=Psychromonas aquimarina TaxID=444919 RepID=UPI000414D573|nr:OmpH family outer membrane protein [Psychromonas aquimarina]